MKNKEFKKWKLNHKFCYLCGSLKSVTWHHIHKEGIRNKQIRKENCIFLFRGEVIPLCRECHNEVEIVKNEIKLYKKFNEAFDKGKLEGIRIIEGDLLRKSNHLIGCMLECYVNILEYRGFNEEAKELEEIASKLK
ncbi:MAG: hypothetical protein AABY22_08095 [Nanoarchaeota archaeon]